MENERHIFRQQFNYQSVQSTNRYNREQNFYSDIDLFCEFRAVET